MDSENRIQIVAQWQSQRNYHYLRYAIFAFFLIALGTVPNLLQSEFFSLATVGYFGMALAVLCLIMDLRNYWLFLDEERDIRKRMDKGEYSGPKVTLILSLFYLLAFLWFSQLVFQRQTKQVILTPDGMDRLARDGAETHDERASMIVTNEKLVHLPSGWTKVTSAEGVEFLLKNEEIRAIRDVDR
jgi:hypothetical protein